MQNIIKPLTFSFVQPTNRFLYLSSNQTDNNYNKYKMY